MKLHIKKELGNIGEKIAGEYLKKLGYKILKTNFYSRYGEIDLIAKDKEEIVFIEVKTRSGSDFGMPSESVNNIKRQHMYRCAKYYLYIINNFDALTRFDVVEVLIQNGKFNVNHIKQIS